MTISDPELSDISVRIARCAESGRNTAKLGRDGNRVTVLGARAARDKDVGRLNVVAKAALVLLVEIDPVSMIPLIRINGWTPCMKSMV